MRNRLASIMRKYWPGKLFHDASTPNGRAEKNELAGEEFL